MNKCIFLGRTTKDVELRYTNENLAIGKFSIAVDTGYGDKKKTNFFNCTVFGKQAETMQKYVTKGNKILLECEALQNSYTDKNGNNVNTVDFRVVSFEFCESKGAVEPGTPTNNTPQFNADGFVTVPDNLADELPFA
jgi:single-strand DNA-binding protein